MIQIVEIGKRIKQARELRGITQEQLGNSLGMNKSTIQRYETGQISKIKLPVLESIAKALRVNPNWIALKSDEMEDTQIVEVIPNLLPLPKTKKVPLVGTIACGEPITAVENIEDYINMPESIYADFCLKCKGDSMINARIFDGDIVYIKQQPYVENGEIAAVLIESEATLKRVFKHKDSLELRAENPTFSPMYYEGTELNDIRILGKAVAFLSAVK